MTELLERLCAAGAQLESLGLSPGSSGNVSVREGSRVWISPTGVGLGSMRPDSLACTELTEDGLVHVDGPAPSKEVGLHAALYLRDPDATCVVHLHSTYAVAASCLPPWSGHSALPPLTPYLLMRVGNLPLLPYHPPGAAEQAADLRHLPLRCHGALLQNHGPVVAGDTVAQAVERAIEIETAARTRVLVGHLPEVRELSDVEAAHLAESYSRPWGVGAGSGGSSDHAHDSRSRPVQSS